MERKAHIEKIIHEDRERKSLSSRIQQIYEQAIGGENEEEALGKLLPLMKQLVQGSVKEILRNSPHGNACDVDDALQEGHMSLVTTLREHREKGKKVEFFTAFAMRLYKNKAFDFVRNSYRTKGQQEELPLEMETDEGKTVDVVPAPVETYPEEILLSKEKQRLNRTLLMVYCKNMMEDTSPPQKMLALCYGRVLYLLSRFGEVVKTLSSPKWAWEQVEKKSLEVLSNDSEKVLAKEIHWILKWGTDFRKALQEPTVPEEAKALGEAIYGELYTIKMLSDWMESMHKRVFKGAKKQILSDPHLLGEIVSMEEKFYDSLGGEIR